MTSQPSQHQNSSPRAIRYLLAALAAILAALTVNPAAPAQAHPPDMFFHAHAIQLTPGGIQDKWTITPGQLLMLGVWEQADANDDDAVSEEEAQAWIAPAVEEIGMSLDGSTPLAWTVESVVWPSSLEELQFGTSSIVVNLSAALPPDLAGQHDLSLHYTAFENFSTHWFALQAEDGLTFATPDQEGGHLSLTVVMPGATDTPDSATLTAWDSGAPSAPSWSAWNSGPPAVPAWMESAASQSADTSPSDADEAQTETAPETQGDDAAPEAPIPVPPTSTGAATILTGLVQTQDLSVSFYLVALGIALLLGAMHALTPGHGKALVAAYLVGSQGTPGHAAALGGVVTLTHTGSVLGLGVLTLVASRFFMPTTIFPVLEIFSGLLVAGLGVSLMLRRWRGYRAVRRATADPAPPKPDAPPESGGTRLTIGESIPVKGTLLPGADLAGAVTWRSLLTLGVSGGLVPCPDAIAILLVAVAINRLLLGLTLIVSFSLGLAVVLIGVGMAMVRSRRLLDRFDALKRLGSALPVVSALAVTGLGVALTVGAVRNVGLLAGGPSTWTVASVVTATPTPEAEPDAPTQVPTLTPTVEPTPVPLQLEHPGVLYVVADEAERPQLFYVALAGGEPVRLTEESEGIWDYALASDGEQVVYSALRRGVGSDLWLLNLNSGERRQVLACPQTTCNGAVWTPDDQRLTYERRGLSSSNNLLVLPTIWWLDPETGQSEAVFADSQLPSLFPGWSANGQWLSYVTPGAGGTNASASVRVYNLEDGRSHTIPTQTSNPVIWDPAGDTLLLTDIRTQDERPLSHLLRFDLTDAQLTDLSAATNANAEDRWAAWSPDGTQIAIVREIRASGGPSTGDEVWLARPDGTDIRPLTDEPGLFHGPPVWSPDGTQLLFRQYALDELWAKPAIMLLDVETGELRQIVKPGYQPTWVP